MNVQGLKEAGIDYDRGVKRFVGRANLYEKALSKFPKDGTFERIRAAYEADDAQALLASAHELKGMCGNIAMTGLYEAADALVSLLRGGEASPAAVNAAYETLKMRYQTAYEAIVAAMEAQG